MAIRKCTFFPYEQRIMVENYTGWRGNIKYIASLLGNKYSYWIYVSYIKALIKDGLITPPTEDERLAHRADMEDANLQHFLELHPNYRKEYYQEHKTELRERFRLNYRNNPSFREYRKAYYRKQYHAKKAEKVG